MAEVEGVDDVRAEQRGQRPGQRVETKVEQGEVREPAQSARKHITSEAAHPQLQFAQPRPALEGG